MSSSHSSRARDLKQAVQEQTRSTYREAILDAAESVFVRQGFPATKMVDVAKESGVSVGTLYNYFDSKEALFVALLEWHRQLYFAQIEEPVTADDPLLALARFVERSMGFLEENGRLFAIYVVGATPSMEGVPRAIPLIDPEEDNRRFARVLSGYVSAAIEQGHLRGDLGVEELTWGIRAMLQMVIHDWFHAPERVSLVDRSRQVVRLFFEGALKK